MLCPDTRNLRHESRVSQLNRAGTEDEGGREMEIAYKALTETCTLLLDANGFCRSVLAVTASPTGRPARIPASAERCIGAQFVASLDFSHPGGLHHMPEPGTPMLFARIEIDGRITLVRSAKLVAFEAVTQVDSGVRENPSVSYGDDEELTTPFEYDLDDATIPRRPAYTPQGSYASGSVSYPPPATSMKVPTSRSFAPPRVSIPPPPALPRSSQRPAAIAPAPASRRPSVARVSAPLMEAPTLPFKRVAR